jgi:hypothetical protein
LPGRPRDDVENQPLVELMGAFDGDDLQAGTIVAFSEHGDVADDAGGSDLDAVTVAIDRSERMARSPGLPRYRPSCDAVGSRAG